MTLSFLWAALRRRPFSLLCTAFILLVSANLADVPVAIAFLFWLSASLLGVAVWRWTEPAVLRRMGARPLTRLERERFGSIATCAPVTLLVCESARPWLVRGVRSLVVSSGLVDLLEDRALLGLLSQATCEVWPAMVAGQLIVWLGNLAVVVAWRLRSVIAQLGRPLAVLVGSCLVLPMLLWPVGFTRVVGGLFGAAIVGLLAASLLSSGLAAAGLGLFVGWAVVPALQALCAWEWRRAERLADRATIDAGVGWQLLEALELLIWAESAPRPDGVLGLLNPAGAPSAERADRVWRHLSSDQPH